MSRAIAFHFGYLIVFSVVLGVAASVLELGFIFSVGFGLGIFVGGSAQRLFPIAEVAP
jgi:hypothetical protein